MVWTAFFVSGLFICTSSQQIYFNEKNDCISNEHTIEILKRQIDSFIQENARITKNQNRINEEFDQMFKIIKENITDIEDDLKSDLLQIKKDLKNYKDCKELYIDEHTKSGVYEINPFLNESRVSVYCDMDTEDGGRTAIQKRLSGSVSFDRKWAEYRNGFGNISDSYWLGNDVIHQLTKGRKASLYVSITLRNGTKLYELYNQFSVSDETNKYRLFLGGPATGSLGDRMINTGDSVANLSGMSFSTPDRDNDRYSGYSCAAYPNKRGGWWFNACHHAFLNGLWSSKNWAYPWYPLIEDGREIKETAMMIKPH